MAHMSRKEYRQKSQRQAFVSGKAKSEYSQTRAKNRQYQAQKRPSNAIPDFSVHGEVRNNYSHVKLNFWTIFSDRPYVAVFLIVLALFLMMIKLWWGLLILAILVGIGIYIIGHSHHPNRVLSLEFKLKASRKLSMLRALQLGASVIMFLATYMKQVVSVNFSSAGSTDSLHVIEGVLSNQGRYGQQGTYILNLLNTLTGGQLFSSYRYATNSAQMMNSSSGRLIIMWILLLMIAPAFCVLAQFFKEPYARNASLVAAIIAMISFWLTPVFMKNWIVQYAMQNQMSQEVANNAVTIGPMAYVAIACSILVTGIACYRFFKQDNFA